MMNSDGVVAIKDEKVIFKYSKEYSKDGKSKVSELNHLPAACPPKRFERS